ncbi:type VI secretion system Vgr family protein [Polyangium aurulentum]|uniref:type VI secretion system Vgr family protein n=1 Tax=Polyangium aurulentum TaxID=2567896 RepID=UPI0010AEAD6C|nr:type VI secretion system tip protein TssI/VgrG [Polyangium aurulentum]UQA63216.1 type VI secretion system tip protein VgrG [Polyangium aurulentum]
MLFSLSIEGLGELRVLRLAGHESISDLYRFTLDAVAPAWLGALPVDIAGAPARLTFGVPEAPRAISGIVAEVRRGYEAKSGAHHRIVLVPTVARLLLRHDCRIFQEMSAPEIVAAVLRAGAIPSDRYRFALRGVYPKRAYCVQHREADWHFVSRLLEDEGIHYFFEESPGGEVLVMADAPAAHAPIDGGGTLSFRPPLGAMAHGQHVSLFGWTERMVSDAVTLRDYNFLKPLLSLEAHAKRQRDASLPIYDSPGDHETPERGKARAAVRLEETQSMERSGEGESDCPRLVPGRTFLLMEHGDEQSNRPYLVTRVEHRGAAPSPEAELGGERASYENQFEVVTAETPFRPARRTSRPRVHGPQTAVVVGPKESEVHTDAHGRIKVQFHWDRQGKKDEHSSCWIRVAHPWAGSGFGVLFLPRVGHEVVVDFLEGDPDRPMITGSVHHAPTCRLSRCRIKRRRARSGRIPSGARGTTRSASRTRPGVKRSASMRSAIMPR